MDLHHLIDTVGLPILLALLAVGAGSGTSIFLFRRQQRKTDEEIKQIHVQTELMPLELIDKHQLAQASTLGELLNATLKTVTELRRRLDESNAEYAQLEMRHKKEMAQRDVERRLEREELLTKMQALQTEFDKCKGMLELKIKELEEVLKAAPRTQEKQ